MKKIIILLGLFALSINAYSAVDYNEIRRIVVNENAQELDFFLSEIEYRRERVDFNRTLNDNGDTLITLAVWNKKHLFLRVIDRYSFLATTKIDYNKLTKSGSSAVNLAVYSGCIKCLRYLKAAKASFTNIGPSRLDALHTAVYTPKVSSKERLELVEYLVNNGLANMRYRAADGGNALLTTLSRAEEVSQEIALLLLENLMNPNVRNEYKDTPLHWAASEGYTQVASELIYAGAFVDIKNNSGSTPLSLAVFRNKPDIVRLLVEEGDADVDLISGDNIIPIMMAANNNSREMVEIMSHQSDWAKSANKVLEQKEETVSLILELVKLSNSAFENTLGSDLWDIGIVDDYISDQKFNSSPKMGLKVKDAKSRKVCGYSETIYLDFRRSRPFEEVSVPSHVGVVGLKFTDESTTHTGTRGIPRKLSFIMPFKNVEEKNKWVQTFDRIHNLFKQNENFGNGPFVMPSRSSSDCFSLP